MTSEPQYNRLFDFAGSGVAALGVMANYTWQTDPRRLGFTLARYKFVSKMLSGNKCVLEVGCADAWATRVVAAEVGRVVAVDMDPQWVEEATRNVPDNVMVRQHDLLSGPVYQPDRLPKTFDAAYALDVVEHVEREHETCFLGNVALSIGEHGTFILGMPSLESQQHASIVSREGHVNCKTQDELRDVLRRLWRNVYLFGMSDETLHTGYGPMCHYRFAICTGAKL